MNRVAPLYDARQLGFCAHADQRQRHQRQTSHQQRFGRKLPVAHHLMVKSRIRLPAGKVSLISAGLARLASVEAGLSESVSAVESIWDTVMSPVALTHQIHLERYHRLAA